MTPLKTLVICMGLLIVVGLGLVGYGLTRPSPRGAGQHGEAGAVSQKGDYFATELPVPRGGKLDQVAATGDRLVLHFTGGDGDRILLLDVHSGQLTGSVTLVPESR